MDYLLTSGTTAGLVLAVGWLLRNLIATRLRGSVEHEFNVKLERISSELRASEDRLRAELGAKEAEIRALREGAMTAMISRQVATDNRRLQAVDQIWASVVSLNPARAASRWLRSIRLEALAEAAQSNPRVLDFLNALPVKYDAKSFKPDANSARPFVTPMAWATYSAYVSVCTHSPIIADAILHGGDVRRFFNIQAMRDTIVGVLPEEASAVAKVDEHSLFELFIEPLEQRLLKELQAILDGRELDGDRVKQAAAIISAVDALREPDMRHGEVANPPENLKVKVPRP